MTMGEREGRQSEETTEAERVRCDYLGLAERGRAERFTRAVRGACGRTQQNLQTTYPGEVLPQGRATPLVALTVRRREEGRSGLAGS